MFRGMTGEVLRPAACIFIEKMSLSKMPFHDDDILGEEGGGEAWRGEEGGEDGGGRERGEGRGGVHGV